MATKGPYTRSVVDTKTFPGALVMLVYRGIVRGELAHTRVESALLFVLAIAVATGAVFLAPLIWAWTRFRGGV